MSQIDMRSQYAQEDTTNEPINVYVEEDEDEEFEDEMIGEEEDEDDGDMMEVSKSGHTIAVVVNIGF